MRIILILIHRIRIYSRKRLITSFSPWPHMTAVLDKMRHSLSRASFFATIMAISTMPLMMTSSVADECSSIRLGAHLSKKTVQGGGNVKLDVNLKNVGIEDVTEANLRIELPPGVELARSFVVPKLKPRSNPINLLPNIYWTNFTLRKKKGRKFALKVRKKFVVLICLTHMRLLLHHVFSSLAFFLLFPPRFRSRWIDVSLPAFWSSTPVSICKRKMAM